MMALFNWTSEKDGDRPHAESQQGDTRHQRSERTRFVLLGSVGGSVPKSRRCPKPLVTR
jgi:hypothetical protein